MSLEDKLFKPGITIQGVSWLFMVIFFITGITYGIIVDHFPFLFFWGFIASVVFYFIGAGLTIISMIIAEWSRP